MFSAPAKVVGKCVGSSERAVREVTDRNDHYRIAVHWVKGLWTFFRDVQEKGVKRAQKAKSLLSRR
jgi:hypothetical protein